MFAQVLVQQVEHGRKICAERPSGQSLLVAGIVIQQLDYGR